MASRGMRRSPYGERGLKWIVVDDVVSDARRSPYGERGLKCRESRVVACRIASLSLRRAWIEIVRHIGSCLNRRVALLTESVD